MKVNLGEWVRLKHHYGTGEEPVIGRVAFISGENRDVYTLAPPCSRVVNESQIECVCEAPEISRKGAIEEIPGVRICTQMVVRFLRAKRDQVRLRAVNHPIGLYEADALDIWASEIEAGKHLTMPDREE